MCRYGAHLIPVSFHHGTLSVSHLGVASCIMVAFQDVVEDICGPRDNAGTKYSTNTQWSHI